MQNALKFYINGDWVDPVTPRSCEVINPATEQPMGRISLGDSADVDRAVSAARKAFDSYSRTSREQRIGYFEKILQGYKDRWEDIAQSISLEMGAPITLATGSQAEAGYGNLSSALEALKTFEFEYQLGNTRIIHEAIGVCGLRGWLLKKHSYRVCNLEKLKYLSPMIRRS